MKAKEKEEARRLRRSGMSPAEISRELGVSKSTAYMWVRDIELTDIQKERFKTTSSKEAQSFLALPPDVLCELVHKGLNQADIAGMYGVSTRVVRRAFKKHGMSGVTRKARISNLGLECEVCGKPRGDKSWGRICNTCTSKIRRLSMKIKLVGELGGKCEGCGWTPVAEEVVAMEFHHKGDDKDFTIGRRLNRKWETLIKEAKKCKLLCSRCHRISHSRMDYIVKYALDRV